MLFFSAFKTGQRTTGGRNVRAKSHTKQVSRRNAAFVTLSLLASATLPVNAAEFADNNSMNLLNRKGSIELTDEQWKQKLTPAQYSVLRKAGTERPFTSPLNNEKRQGTFTCAGCGAPVFKSEAKFDSGTGWPSFYEPVAGAVDELPDFSIFFMPRTEVRCHRCKGHLGHVFNDGPKPTGQRYCMNGAAMGFEPSNSA